jgi:hypothetical protein
VAQIIQVEIRTGTTHTMTWLDAALKLKPGMVLVCKGDPRPWTVVHSYGLTAREVKGSSVCWKVAGCETPICAA